MPRFLPPFKFLNTFSGGRYDRVDGRVHVGIYDWTLLRDGEWFLGRGCCRDALRDQMEKGREKMNSYEIAEVERIAERARIRVESAKNKKHLSVRMRAVTAILDEAVRQNERIG